MPKKPHILLIDDDPVTRRLFEYKFMLAGFSSVMAPTAEEALPALETQTFDLIITDLLMPKYSGVDVIECLKETPYTKDIPVFLFTAGGNPDLVKQAVELGVSRVFMKHSTSPDQLVTAIKQQLRLT